MHFSTIHVCLVVCFYVCVYFSDIMIVLIYRKYWKTIEIGFVILYLYSSLWKVFRGQSVGSAQLFYNQGHGRGQGPTIMSKRKKCRRLGSCNQQWQQGKQHGFSCRAVTLPAIVALWDVEEIVSPFRPQWLPP